MQTRSFGRAQAVVYLTVKRGAPSASEGVAKPHSTVMARSVILRERTRTTVSITIACTRPKDLLSASERHASLQEFSPTILPARSFGRRQSASYQQVAWRRLPQDD